MTIPKPDIKTMQKPDITAIQKNITAIQTMNIKPIDITINMNNYNFIKKVTESNQSLTELQKQATTTKDSISSFSDKISSGFSKVASGIKGAFSNLGLDSFLKNSLNMANDLNEVENLVNSTFSNASSKIDSFAKDSISNFGLTQLQAKKFSNEFGTSLSITGKSGDELADMSIGLTKLSGDMASFHNIQPEEAFEKINSALNGSDDSLKSLGINMQEDAVQAYAMSNGLDKQWSSLSDSEKMLWRYKKILNDTNKEQGDYSKNSAGFSNSFNTLKGKIADIGTTIMGATIPTFEKLFTKINECLSNFNVESFANIIGSAFETLYSVISWVGNNLDWLAPLIASVVSALGSFVILKEVNSLLGEYKKWLDGATLMNKIFNSALMKSPFTWIAIGIGVLVGALILAYNKSEWFREKVNQLWETLKTLGSTVGDFLSPIFQAIGEFITNSIVPSFSNLFNIIATNLLPVIQQIGEWITTNLIPAFQVVGKILLEALFPVFTALANIVMNTIMPLITHIVESIINFFVPIIQSVTEVLTSLYNSVILPISEFVQNNVLPALDVLGMALMVLIFAFSKLLAEILEPLAEFLVNILTAAFDLVFQQVTSGFLIFYETISGVLEGVIKIFSGLIDFVTGVFTGNWQQAWEGIKEIFSGIFDGMLSICKGVVNSIINSINFIIRGFNAVAGIKLPDVLGGGSIGISIPEIPTFSTGTQYFKGGFAEIGEHGGEIVNLPNGTQIIPNSLSQNMNGGRDIDVNINIGGNVIGNDDFLNQLGDKLTSVLQNTLINMA